MFRLTSGSPLTFKFFLKGCPLQPKYDFLWKENQKNKKVCICELNRLDVISCIFASLEFRSVENIVS